MIDVRTLGSALLLVCVLAAPSSATAATIVYDRGIAFSLVNNGLAYDPVLGTDAFEFVYQLDTAGYDGAEDADFIGAISIKVTSAALNGTNSRLASYDAPGTWTYVPNSVSSQAGGGPSCSAGGGGWACASDGTSAIVPGGIYTFVFLLAVPEESLLLDLDAASIHASYGRFDRFGNIKPAGVTSRSITIDTPPDTPDTPGDPVPEPAALMMLGVALLAVAARARRRREV